MALTKTAFFVLLILFSTTCLFGLTVDELKLETAETYKDLTLQDWKDKSDYRGITKRSQKDFDNLIPMYVKKIGQIREQLRGNWSVTLTPIIDDKLKTPEEMGNELTEEIQYLLEKETRLIDKFAACVKEVQMRADGDVVRKGLHDAANYYIDYANGTDSPGGTVHDGLAEPADPGGAVYTAIDGSTTATDGTHCCLAVGDFDNDTDDNYNGDYLYNITRSAGVIITDYDADDGDDASVLIHPNIAGQVAGDTFYILRAAKTITKLTTTEVRTVGDILYLRANTTWTQGTEAVDIIFDEDGTDDDYIKIIGCGKVGDGDSDPWVDDNATLPIIDFEDAAYQFKLDGDNFWYFERLDIRRSNDSNGSMYLNGVYGIYLKTCTFRDATSGVGFYTNVATATFDTCTFIDNTTNSLKISYSGRILVKSCTFNAGAGGTNIGIAASGPLVFVIDSTFGATTAHATEDIAIIKVGNVYTRNCTWNTTPTVTNRGILYSEDDNSTFESQKVTTDSGIITRDTGAGNLHSGGANSSAKMAPSSTCGPNNPLTLGGNPLSRDFKIWLSAAQHTVTVYANRVDSDWATEPVAANFYIQASYLSNGASAARTLSTASTQDIADSDTWTGFTTTFTMAREGWAYIRVSLEKYESGKFVYVDIKPVIS